MQKDIDIYPCVYKCTCRYTYTHLYTWIYIYIYVDVDLCRPVYSMQIFLNR